MSLIKSTREIEAVDRLLKMNVSGTWFLRTELEEYVDTATLNELIPRLDAMYGHALLKNVGRTFTPNYRINRLGDGDTAHPKVYLELLKPCPHLHVEKMGEIELLLSFNQYGAIDLRLREESAIEGHIRENNWKVSAEELKLLNELVDITNRINSMSRHIKVVTDYEDRGLTIHTNYTNPLDQVRAALTR